MALVPVVERSGTWSVLQGMFSQDAALLQEGERYQQVFFLKPYPSAMAPVLQAEMDMLVKTLKLRGVEEVSGTFQGNKAILNYRAGVNPLAVLAIILTLAIVLILLLTGYAIYQVTGVVPGIPAWVKIGLAAAGVLWVGSRLMRRLT